MSQTSISGVPVYEVIKPDGTPLGAWALPDILRFYSSGEWDGDYLAQIPRVKGMTPIRKLVAIRADSSAERLIPCTHWSPMQAWWHSVVRMFDISGRASREECAQAIVGHAFILVAWVLVFQYTEQLVLHFYTPYHAYGSATIVFFVISNMLTTSLIPLISLCIRRLHDTGKRAALLPLLCLSVIGLPYLLVLLCRRSKGANIYGGMAPQAPAYNGPTNWLHILYEMHAGMLRLSGRCPRGEYWGIVIVYLICFFSAVIAVGCMQEEASLCPTWSFRSTYYICFCFGLLLLLHLPTVFCATVRRLHDTNHSAWCLLLLLFPPALIALLLFRSTGPNRYNEADICFLCSKVKVSPQPRWSLRQIMTSAFLRFDDWEGRAGRREFFSFAAVCAALGIGAWWIHSFADEAYNPEIKWVINGGLLTLVALFLPPLCALAIRRVHDAGCSAWWLPVIIFPGLFCLVGLSWWPLSLSIATMSPALFCLLYLPTKANNPYAAETEWPL